MIVVKEITGTAALRVYRITKTGDPQDPAFVDSFKSHYELGMPPRRFETRSSVIHMGITTWQTESRAIGTARAFPKIGSFVAEMVLTGNNGFNYAETGPPGHFTVWGDPLKLAAAVDDIAAIAA
jgi:hypothetical protein